MSLKHYQQAWRNVLQNEHLIPEQLTETERLHLENWQAHLPQQQHVFNTIREHLMTRLPVSLRSLLPDSFLKLVLADFIRQNHSFELLLHFVSQRPSPVPHFEDVCRYEIALKNLTFYQLPTPFAQAEGPVLARWARVLSLGPHFPLVLTALQQGRAVEDLQETPLQNYLLLREFKGPRLLPLPPLEARCLEACTGKKTWGNIVDKVLADHPSPHSARENLLRAETHYLQEGILLKSALPGTTAS